MKSFRRPKKTADEGVDSVTPPYVESESRESVQDDKPNENEESFELLSQPTSNRRFLPAFESEDAAEEPWQTKAGTPAEADFHQVRDKLGPSIYFADGERKIDYVLLFYESIEGQLHYLFVQASSLPLQTTGNGQLARRWSKRRAKKRGGECGFYIASIKLD